MVKQIIFISIFVFLFSCKNKKYDYVPGSEFLGNWHMEALKNPKYPHYIFDYSITKNGNSFNVKVHVTCPKCKDSVAEERNYIFAGNYNEDQNVFEIKKEGYKEILSIPEMQEYMVSSRFPKYVFTEIKQTK